MLIRLLHILLHLNFHLYLKFLKLAMLALRISNILYLMKNFLYFVICWQLILLTLESILFWLYVKRCVENKEEKVIRRSELGCGNYYSRSVGFLFTFFYPWVSLEFHV